MLVSKKPDETQIPHRQKDKNLKANWQSPPADRQLFCQLLKSTPSFDNPFSVKFSA
jgi:hypothetical protein